MDEEIVVEDVDNGDDDGGRWRRLQDHDYDGDGNPRGDSSSRSLPRCEDSNTFWDIVASLFVYSLIRLH
jgi:hypothetical protein